MELDLKNLISEYSQRPFTLHSVKHTNELLGEIEQGYSTNATSFLLPVRGKLEITFNDQRFVLEPGKIVHGCPGKWISAKQIDQEPIEFFNIYYMPDEIVSGRNYMQQLFELTVGTNYTTLGQIKILQQALSSNACYSPLRAKAIMYTILDEIFSSAYCIGIKGNRAIIEEAAQFIKIHRHEYMTLGSLSQRYHMSGKYFSALFYKYMGITPIQYATQCRMEAAKEMLLYTSDTVKEIGNHVGYDDAYYFSRIFKKHFGMSPSALRQGEGIQRH